MLPRNSPVLAVFFLAFGALGAVRATGTPQAEPSREGVPAANIPADTAATSGSTGFFVDFAPLAGIDTRPARKPGDGATGADLFRFSGRPAFASLGFAIRAGGFAATTALDLHQDFGAFLLGESWSNLPKAPDAWGLMWGNTYPQVGYATYSHEFLYVSAGRRRLGFGPGEGSVSLSALNPWSDHLVASVGAPAGAGKVGYSFAAAGVQRWYDMEKKTVFSHRFSWTGRRIAFAIGELNLVTGDSIDLQDIGPFLVYHHLFNSNSNVMLDLELEAAPVDGMRLYGQFVMDDLRLPNEPLESNPTAMGFLGGLEFSFARAFPGAFAGGGSSGGSGGHSGIPLRPAFFREDHALRLRAIPEAAKPSSGGGLSLAVEVAAASKYLYRRIASSPQQAWTGRYFVQSSTAIGWPLIEPFLAGSMAPDTRLATLSMNYAAQRFESRLSASYRLSGPGSTTSTYAPPYDEDWFGLGSPVVHTVDLTARVRWAATSRILLSGDLSCSITDGVPVFSSFIGLSWRLGSGGLSLGE